MSNKQYIWYEQYIRSIYIYDLWRRIVCPVICRLLSAIAPGWSPHSSCIPIRRPRSERAASPRCLKRNRSHLLRRLCPQGTSERHPAALRGIALGVQVWRIWRVRSFARARSSSTGSFSLSPELSLSFSPTHRHSEDTETDTLRRRPSALRDRHRAWGNVA